MVTDRGAPSIKSSQRLLRECLQVLRTVPLRAAPSGWAFCVIWPGHSQETRTGSHPECCTSMCIDISPFGVHHQLLMQKHWRMNTCLTALGITVMALTGLCAQTSIRSAAPSFEAERNYRTQTPHGIILRKAIGKESLMNVECNEVEAMVYRP